MPKKGKKENKQAAGIRSENYRHPEADILLRPEIGTQPQFRKKKPPKTYRYDSSLSPALDWDGQNPAREQGETLIREIFEAGSIEKAKAAAAKLKALSGPFLNWAGKAERISFDVPTLPLFVHERLSTKGIIETLKGHRKEKFEQVDFIFNLFGDPRHSISDQVLRAYEYRDQWVNRMISGDSLVVMNSLLEYESLGGQVQMIYMDPPYGVKFGSNFQPFVRKRDVTHNDDDDLTREPEMVKAYRDTWELGLHSYLTYLRDRLLIARDLLQPTGSIFVQIGEENLHQVRNLLDEVFGSTNICRMISYITTSFQADKLIANTVNYLLWYAKDKEFVKTKTLFKSKKIGDIEAGEYKWILLPDGTTRIMTESEYYGIQNIPYGAQAFRYGPLTSQGYSESGSKDFEFKGKVYSPGINQHWKTDLNPLAEKGLLIPRENSLSYLMFLFYIAFEMSLIQGQLVKIFIAFLLADILRKPVSACSVAASSESNTRFVK